MLVAVSALVLGALVGGAALLGWGRRRATALAARGAPRTAANARSPAVEAPTTIAFLGDVQRGVRDVARPVVEALVTARATLLVSSGDLASHGEAPYHGIVGRAFDRAGLSIPLLVTVGNHDVQPRGVRDPAPGRRLFERLYGPRTWEASAGPLRLLGVDNGGCWIDDGQIDWLERRLAAHPDAPWLLVIHRPPREMLEASMPTSPGHARLLGVISSRPPEVVVSGHLERDMEAVVDDVRYVVNAEGGDVSGGLFRRPAPFRLLLADVAADGRVSLRRVELSPRRDRSVVRDQVAVGVWSASRRPALRLLGRLGDLLVRPFARRRPTE